MKKKIHLGYACINTTISFKIRTLRLKTYREKGNAYLKELVLNNLRYVRECLKWNVKNEVDFFRISSDLVPLATHHDMKFDWGNDKDVITACSEVRSLGRENNIRLSMHPGQYTLLNSPQKDVVSRAVADLEYHAGIGELLGITDIVLHTGGVYGNKQEALKRWLSVYNSLSGRVKSLIRLENDEWSYKLSDVLELSAQCGVPVVLDFHHHRLNHTSGLEDLLEAVVLSWKDTGSPKFHLSTGKTGPMDPRHHDYILSEDYREACGFLLEVPGLNEIYLMLEAKQKEQAVLRLKNMKHCMLSQLQ